LAETDRRSLKLVEPIRAQQCREIDKWNARTVIGMIMRGLVECLVLGC